MWEYAAACAVLLVLWFLVTPRRYAPGPLILPFVGTPQDWFLSTLQGDIVKANVLNRSKYGPVYQLMFPSFWPSYVFVVSDPKVMKFVLGNPASFPERPKGLFYQVAPNGLIALPSDEKWTMHRNVLTPILTHKDFLGQFVEMINNVADKMLDKMAKKPSLEVSAILTAATFDVISEAGFGFNPNTLEMPESKFTHALKIVFQQAVAFQFFPRFLLNLVGYTAKFNQTLNVLKEFAKYARKSAMEVTSSRDNVVNLLEKASVDSEFDREDITDETITLMLAGHETTAHTLSWAIRTLAENPECQKRAFDEVLSVLGRDKSPTFEMVNNSAFPYLEAVILETLRLYPTVSVFIRRCAKDTSFENYFFPEGSRISITVPGCNLSEEYWEAPLEFRPDRFLGLSPTQETKLKSERGFYPFGGGKRMCVGKRFALTEAAVLLARVLQRFEIKPNFSAPRSRGKTFATLYPEKGVHVICTPRA